jgi:hypothetical protein
MCYYFKVFVEEMDDAILNVLDKYIYAIESCKCSVSNDIGYHPIFCD